MIHAEWNQWIWDVLTIPPTDDDRTIKRAYSKLLKVFRPDEDAEKFQQLRQAYDAALALARHARESAEQQTTTEEEAVTPQELTLLSEEISPDIQEIPPVEMLSPIQDPAQTQNESISSIRDAAARAWQAFLSSYRENEHGSLHYRIQDEIRKFSSSDDFLNLDFSHAFELEAAQYCAQEGSDEELRDAMVSYFEWEKESRHLDSPQQVLSHLVLGRYRADAMYRYLQTKSNAGKVLLENKPPRYSLKIYSKKFSTELRELLQHIRWNCPQVVWYRLNQDVVNWWEQQLAKPSLHDSAKVQLGWLPIYAILSSLRLLDLQAPFINEVVSAGLYVVPAFAIFANWEIIAALRHRNLLLVFYLSMMLFSVIAALDELKNWHLLIPPGIVIAKGGQNFYALIDEKLKYLARIRFAWLSVSIVLFPIIQDAWAGYPDVCSALSWLLTTSALLLTSWYLGKPWIGPLSMFGIFILSSKLILLNMPDMAIAHEKNILTCWVVAAIYMVINMTLSAIKKRPYA